MGVVDPVLAREKSQERLDVLIVEFLAYLRDVRNLSPNTVRAYEGDLVAYGDWVRREGVDPLSVTHRELRRYLGELTQARYARRTVNRRLSAVRAFYKWLLHEGYTTSDAAAAVSSPKLSKTLPAVMSDADVRRLFSSCDLSTAAGIRDRAMLELMYATGARISEVSGLDVRDVDQRQGQVSLFGKGSKERIVPVYDAALEAIGSYLRDARPQLLEPRVARGEAAGEQALFLSSRGMRMSADALRKRFELCVGLAGLDPSLTPHSMRHTYATELLGGGADLRTVQELLGHRSLSTTQIYTHLSVERLKEAAHQAHPRG